MTEKPQGLWVTDAELIRRSGVPEKKMRSRLAFYDAHPALGFPRKNPLWGNLRYWPAVQEFWQKTQDGSSISAPVRSKANASA